jgi:hypothetical protein
VVHRNLGNLCRGRVCSHKRTTDEVHPSESEVTDRSHPKVLFAGGSEGSLRRADGCANVSQIQRPVRVSFQKLFKPRDDSQVGKVLAARRDAISRASDQRVNQLLLKRPNNFRKFEKFWAGLSYTPGHRV